MDWEEKANYFLNWFIVSLTNLESMFTMQYQALDVELVD